VSKKVDIDTDVNQQQNDLEDANPLPEYDDKETDEEYEQMDEDEEQEKCQESNKIEAEKEKKVIQIKFECSDDDADDDDDDPNYKLLKREATGGKVACLKCGKILRNASLLPLHYAYQHQPLHCKLCQKQFIGKKELQHHEYIVHQKYDNFPCSTCGKDFFSVVAMKNHKKKEHKLLVKRGRPVQKQHQYQHPVLDDRNRYKCPHCEKTFTSPWNVTAHIESVHNPGNYPCPHCPRKVFPHPRYLRQHTRRSHPDSTL